MKPASAILGFSRYSMQSPVSSAREAIKRYDPTNPEYIDTIVAKTKLNPERKIKSLTDVEFEKFWKAIEATEKWQAGREDFIEKWYIINVHMKRGRIQEYCIHQNGHDVWMSKEKAIGFAQERRLHAILVHHSNGSLYLRPEYHAKPFREMVS